MFKAVAATILIIGTLLFLTNVALSEDSITCSFAGTVKLDGADVADGTAVTAIIEGVEYRTTTPTGYGASTYAISIRSTSDMTYHDGTTVAFRIGDRQAEQTGTWQAGKNIRLDLTASTVSTSSTSESSSNIWLIVGLAVAFVIEVMLVGGTGYVVIRLWNE
jgi:hypothetical protein